MCVCVFFCCLREHFEIAISLSIACAVRTWKTVETYWPRCVPRCGTWYRLAVCTCHFYDDVPSFFFLHQTWTLKCRLSVRPFPFTAAIFCFGSLLLTRIHKLSIARFDFTYREGDVCWHIRLPVECEFFLLFGQVFMLQENRFLQQEQIMLVLPHFRFILCWRLY